MATEKNTEPGAPLPGSDPNSRANLNPWKPGESGNPTGRPKGSRNIRTILDEMLNRYVDMEALKHLDGIDATVELCKQLTDAKNDTRQDSGPKERARLYDLIVAAQFTRALQERDLPSFKELVDRYECAVAQKFEDVTPLKHAEDEEILDMIEGGSAPATNDSSTTPGLEKYSRQRLLDAYLRHRYDAFLYKAFRTVSPGAELKWNWHIGLMAGYLEACRRREITRLVITDPTLGL